MRIVVPFFPVYNHRLGVGYINALLRSRDHEVIPLDFEHLLWLNDRALSLRLQEETEVYGEVWSEQIQFLHRPELLFGALWPDDPQVRRHLREPDWRLIDSLQPHVECWVDAIAELDPGLILFPALVSNFWIALWVSALLHARAPAIPRVFGGRGTSYTETQELVLAAGWADAVLPGEAEESVLALTDSLASGTPISQACTGSLVRMSAGTMVSFPHTSTRSDIDALPFPDFADLPFPGASLRYYSENGRDFHDAVSIGASRWCPRRCAYCYESIYPKNYRLRKVESVLQEIKHQCGRFGTPRLFFCDSTLNVSPPWLKDLAAGMTELPFQPHVVFSHCEPRRLDRALLDCMRSAGFDKINFGVESLDERTLRRMDRHTNIDETECTLLTAVEAGISLGLNLIANYPGETADEFESTMVRASVFADRLRRAAETTGASVRFMVSQARVDPHSSLFVNRDRFGIRIVARELPVPTALTAIAPVIRRIALRWEDGLPRSERAARFRLMRPYIEGLSIAGRPCTRPPFVDTRIALDPARVLAALARLIPSVTRTSMQVVA